MYKDQWLALLGGRVAALYCTARNRWIGWSTAGMTPIIEKVGGSMEIEFLVSPGCSSRDETETRLKEILLILPQEATFQTILIDSPQKAEALKFPGSPTVRINGRDIEPEADKSLNYGLG